MSKIKSLGKANDVGVPEVEINAAKLVQNAKSKGLKWCSGRYFVDGSGLEITLGSKGENAVACCAVGAAHISDDTKNMVLSTAVNDRGDSYFIENYHDNYDDADYAALLYREAMQ